MKVITLYFDPDLQSPMEWDGQWTLYSFNRRHNSYRDPDEFFTNGRPSIGLRRKLEVGLAFILSYSEHGPGTANWYRPQGRPQHSWDRQGFAGLLVWEHSPREMGARTLEDRERDADQFLETYNAWASGDGYGFRVEDEEADGQRSEIASTWGFYGNDLDYMASQIRAAVGDDQDIRVEGEAAFIASNMQLTNPPPAGPRHGPWTPREAAYNQAMDLDEVAVWSDYSMERGMPNLAIDYAELEALKRKLKK